MSMSKIKVGDEVTVIAGRDKGRSGEVIRFTKKDRIFVRAVNMVKKHKRPDPNKQEQGGIIDIEASIHISNVALLNPATKKASRVGIRTLEDGKRVRYFKDNDEVVDI